MSSGFVYLIEARIGVVKIGWSERPVRRLATVRTHSPVPVRLTAFWPGRVADELVLHARFASHRAQNEWFRIDGDLLSFVRERAGQGVGSVEDWDFVSFGGPGRTEESRRRQRDGMKAAWQDPAQKLVWLGQMRAGRLQSLSYGHIPLAQRTPAHFKEGEDLRLRAHQEVRASARGQELIALIAARGEPLPDIPGHCRRIASVTEVA